MKHEAQPTLAAAGSTGNSSPLDNGFAADGAQSAVAREYHAFLGDVEHLISSVTSMTAEELARAKAKLGSYINTAKASVGQAGSAVVDRARSGAKATDRYVRDQPWQAVGITAVAGLLIGFLLGRRNS